MTVVEMVSIKYLNEGFIRTPCVCWRLFRKAGEKLSDMIPYQKLMAKGIENLTIGDELFVINYDIDEVKSMYVRLQNLGTKIDSLYVCQCGRKYLLPDFENICEFQRNLCGRHYMEITNG